MILRTENLTSSYGDVTVVRDVSLVIRPGDVVAVLGANGAGKTTMVRAITNLHDRKSGIIVFDGIDITRLPPNEIVKLGLALVPEHRHVFARMSVMENLLMGGYLLNRETNRETLRSVFELFPRLQERSKQLAGTLSGGEQQMLAIGRGLMAKPKLLILDEPSMGLAPLLVKEVYASLERLVGGGKITILLVEQNAREALSIAQRVYVMERGEISVEAKPDDIRGSLLQSYLQHRRHDRCHASILSMLDGRKTVTKSGSHTPQEQRMLPCRIWLSRRFHGQPGTSSISWDWLWSCNLRARDGCSDRRMEGKMAAGYGLEDFIRDVRAVAPRQLSSGETLRSIAPGFRQLLNNRSFLKRKAGRFERRWRRSMPLRRSPTTISSSWRAASAGASRTRAHRMITAAYGRFTGSTRAAHDFNATRPTRPAKQDHFPVCD